MFAIEVQRILRAGHALRLPGNMLEPHHDHAFEVTIRIQAKSLDEIETVLDFHPVEVAIDSVLAPWQNKSLNDVEPFKTQVNPSAERIAEQIGLQLIAAIKKGAESAHPIAGITVADLAPHGTGRGIHVAEVRITEAPGCVAIWTPDAQ